MIKTFLSVLEKKEKKKRERNKRKKIQIKGKKDFTLPKMDNEK